MNEWFVMSNPLMLVPLLLLIVLGGGVGLALWLDGRDTSRKTKKQEQSERTQRARDVARCREIEEGLREWLTTLGLPQLEEKTRLEAAARQLRIVLVEKLMHGPRVR